MYRSNTWTWNFGAIYTAILHEVELVNEKKNEKFSSICRNVEKKRRRDGENERPNNGMDAINILFTVSV